MGSEDIEIVGEYTTSSSGRAHAKLLAAESVGQAEQAGLPQTWAERHNPRTVDERRVYSQRRQHEGDAL